LNKLKKLPEQTLVHCAHEYTLSNIKFALAVEPQNNDLLAWQQTAQSLRQQGVPTVPTTMAHEKRVNPFLRCEESSVIESVRKQKAINDSHPVTVFAHLRSWKDTFRA
jgi:hydroxyacylglutathione hydrolase